METFTLKSGKRVLVNVEEHADGYIVMHQMEGAASVQHTCCCGSKGCVTKTCPGWNATCDCTGSSPRITCN